MLTTRNGGWGVARNGTDGRAADSGVHAAAPWTRDDGITGEEEAALRRVATLVACGAPPD